MEYLLDGSNRLFDETRYHVPQPPQPDQMIDTDRYEQQMKKLKEAIIENMHDFLKCRTKKSAHTVQRGFI